MANRISRVIRAYMAYHGITGRSLAKKAGVDPKMITFVIDLDRTSPKVIRAMIDAGIPRQLLKRLRHSGRSLAVLEAETPIDESRSHD